MLAQVFQNHWLNLPGSPGGGFCIGHVIAFSFSAHRLQKDNKCSILKINKDFTKAADDLKLRVFKSKRSSKHSTLKPVHPSLDPLLTDTLIMLSFRQMISNQVERLTY